MKYVGLVLLGILLIIILLLLIAIVRTLLMPKKTSDLCGKRCVFDAVAV